MSDLTEIIAKLAALDVNLPVGEHPDDFCTIVDADGRDVCVVDYNHAREEDDAREITGLLIQLINLAGSGPVPIEPREG